MKQDLLIKKCDNLSAISVGSKDLTTTNLVISKYILLNREIKVPRSPYLIV